MSRTGLDAKSTEMIENIVDSVDKVTSLSRATLRRELKKILRDFAGSEGQDGPKLGHDEAPEGCCHAPP